MYKKSRFLCNSQHGKYTAITLLPFCFYGCLHNQKDNKNIEYSLPNVVLINADDLGYGDLGCYGAADIKTTNIDLLAQQGCMFTDFHTASAVSTPSRFGLITGCYPCREDIWAPVFLRSPLIIDTTRMTIARVMKQAGYETAMTGKWHLGEDPSTPLAHGFDIRVPEGEFGGKYYAPFNIKGIDCRDGDYLTDRLTDEALRFIDNNKEHPFFLYLSHFAVHNPLEGRKDLVEKYKKKLNRMPVSEGPPYVLEGNPDDPDPFTPEETRILINNKEYEGFYDLPNRMIKIKQFQDNEVYAAMVESMDESFGRIVARVKELGLDDKTIIMFFSDNGGRANGTSTNTSTSNLPLRGAKGWLYEGGIRVPLSKMAGT